jgi:hypothetical protein
MSLSSFGSLALRVGHVCRRQVSTRAGFRGRNEVGCEPRNDNNPSKDRKQSSRYQRQRHRRIAGWTWGGGLRDPKKSKLCLKFYSLFL